MRIAKSKITKPMNFGLSTLSLSIAVFSGLLTQLRAQSEINFRGNYGDSKITSIVKFVPPSDQIVDNSRGGASRAEIKCSHDQAYNHSFKALLPASNQGLTVATHPSFLVYLPKTSAPIIHFTLRDENNRGVYQTTVPIVKTGGIVSISLPEDQPPLQLGKTYQWSVALICQPTQTDIPFASGKVRRIELNSSLSSQLDNKNLLQQAFSYGQAGIWYESLVILAQLRKTRPDDQTIADNWLQLLNSVGLEEIAAEPLL
ncbi:MAG: DUF928 domain-containing protein [Symploca sp. SIO3C6]|nr:DUF928 domain-containing protein [Symploca sp. SIO3C6]